MLTRESVRRGARLSSDEQARMLEATVVRLLVPAGAADPAVPADPSDPVTSCELQDAVRGALARCKVPTSVHVIDALPLSPVGRVLRRAPREPLCADGAPAGERS